LPTCRLLLHHRTLPFERTIIQIPARKHGVGLHVSQTAVSDFTSARLVRVICCHHMSRIPNRGSRAAEVLSTRCWQAPRNFVHAYKSLVSRMLEASQAYDGWIRRAQDGVSLDIHTRVSSTELADTSRMAAKHFGGLMIIRTHNFLSSASSQVRSSVRMIIVWKLETLILTM
jgi:hypothetical protein